MTRYLPDDEIRCSAYWYALRAGMVTDPCDPGDLEFLRELGLRAARLARWEGIPALTVPEGPYQVYLWPERIWSEVADAMANHAAEHGDYGPEDVRQPCDRCNYDTHRCPGCGEPLPHGTEVCGGCDDAWGGRGPSASYAAWRAEGVPAGVPYLVHDVLALDRRYGDPENPHGYWEAGDYG
jgi:hypothetical protein